MPLPRLRQLGIVGALALVLPAIFSIAPSAAATDSASVVRRPMAKVLRAPASGSASSPRAVRATRAPAATRPPTSSWEVTYCGFDAYPKAKEAFQAAVDAWAGLIDTPNDAVPIRVKATFKDLRDPDILGQAGPTDFILLDRDGARTAYPVALANSLRGKDSTPTSSISCTSSATTTDGSDITAEFNNNAGKVYYGTDGALPDASYVDFETVVLHELGHGLGFLGSMGVDEAGNGFYGDGTPYPDVYDRFTVRSGGTIQGKRLLSYANGSTALGDALTSGAVYWDGPYGKAAYSGRPPRLYVPQTFEPASSYSHVSDADFPSGDPNSLMTPFVENNEVIREPGPVVLGMFADMGWRTPQPAGVRYTPTDPVRVLDTRSGLGGTFGRLPNDTFIDVRVVGGAVPTDATAVVLNVTGVGATFATDLRVFPTPRSGTARPLVSNLNLARGDTRANLVTVPVGEGGKVRVYNTAGTPHVLIDVEGWYGASGASLFQPTDPLRVLDTRDGTGGVPMTPVAAGSPLDLKVTGGDRAVPDTATAVILTVTALRATGPTDVRVYPKPGDSSTPGPEASNLNLTPGQIVPNLVIVKVGSGGYVRLQNSNGSVELVADLSGWYDDAGGGALFHALAPQRVLDTRTTSQRVVGAGGIVDLPVTDQAGVPAAGATAVVLNVTGVDASRTTDIRVYPTPTDGSVPLVSNLNLNPGQTAPDLAIVRIGDPDIAGRGQVRLRNAAGTVGLVADLAGWFGP